MTTPTEPVVIAEIVNISQSGMRFFSTPPLPLGAEISFDAGPTRVHGTVVRQAPNGACGAVFEKPLTDRELFMLRQYRRLAT
ncbi:PilZ domain-containing protein [Cognatishimia sp. F0-27]|nr:PilZ domain-containing protein [Cognatishimia sp. F0-27]